MKKLLPKVAHNRPKCFFFSLADRPKTCPKHIFPLHKNVSLHDFYIMTLDPTMAIWVKDMYANQSHYIEVVQGDIFMGRENVIWAGFGPVGNTGKKSAWANYEQLLRAVFHAFGVKRNYKEI